MTEYIIKAADWAIDYNGDSLFKDAEEIVRCRDCAYMFDWAYGRPLCKLWAFNDPDESESCSGNALYPKVELEGFCAWGERKEGGDD